MSIQVTKIQKIDLVFTSIKNSEFWDVYGFTTMIFYDTIYYNLCVLEEVRNESHFS